jgi:hypothetical protein
MNGSGTEGEEIGEKRIKITIYRNNARKNTLVIFITNQTSLLVDKASFFDIRCVWKIRAKGVVIDGNNGSKRRT